MQVIAQDHEVEQLRQAAPASNITYQQVRSFVRLLCFLLLLCLSCFKLSCACSRAGVGRVDGRAVWQRGPDHSSPGPALVRPTVSLVCRWLTRSMNVWSTQSKLLHLC